VLGWTLQGCDRGNPALRPEALRRSIDVHATPGGIRYRAAGRSVTVRRPTS
jgi:hypothetical protein